MGKPAADVDMTRDLPPLSFRATVSPDTVNEEKRTVELVWTTGARVLRGFLGRYFEELSLDPAHVRMGRLNNGAPFLDNHDTYSGAGAVLGVVESARLEKGRGVAVVRFAKAEDDPAADAVFRKVKDGILQNISVGYRTYKMEKVAGGEAEIPVYRAVDWEPFELSVVPAGADDGAGFRNAQTRAATNPCSFVVNVKETRTMADPVTPAAAPASASPTPTPANAVEEATRAAAEARARESEAQAAATARATETALQRERERTVEIRSLVRRARLPDELADKLIREGAKIEDVRKAVLDNLTDGSDASAQRGHLVFAGEDVREKFVRGAAASLYQRAGLHQTMARAMKVEGFEAQFRDVSLEPGEFRGLTLTDLARHALEMRGQSVRGLGNAEVVRRALQFRGDSGLNTSSDFAVLLETAVNKVFLGAYAIAPTTFRRWCSIKSVQDFRTSTFYRPGTFSKLDSLTEAGEFKHKNIPDGEKATLTPSTKGNIIGLTRKAIVNDDLGAFRDLAAGLGQAAALSVESDAFALVTVNSGLGPTQGDSQPLFHANRTNIGPTGAMAVATLDGARAVMAKQQDPSKKNYLDLRPAIWLGPVELGGQARVFNEAMYEPTAQKFQVPNMVRGLFREVVDSAFLSASSTTRHYLLADPGISPVFAVAFINGQEAPEIISDQGFEYDGVQWRVRFDYGVGVIDYRGGVTCAGA